MASKVISASSTYRKCLRLKVHSDGTASVPMLLLSKFFIAQCEVKASCRTGHTGDGGREHVRIVVELHCRGSLVVAEDFSIDWDSHLFVRIKDMHIHAK